MEILSQGVEAVLKGDNLATEVLVAYAHLARCNSPIDRRLWLHALMSIKRPFARPFGTWTDSPSQARKYTCATLILAAQRLIALARRSALGAV